MRLTDLILLALNLSLGMSIFAVGLNATLDDATCVLRQPGKFLRALASMYVVLPAFAVMLALAFDLNPVVKLALVALSVSPIPPILPRKALKAGGAGNYAVGLLIAATLVAIVVIPLSMALFERIFGVPLQMRAASVAYLVFTSILAPLIGGMLVRMFLPSLASTAAEPVANAASILLLVSFLPVLVSQIRPILALVGNGTVIAFVAFAAVGLFAGHLLGGRAVEDRKVLALYTASRHPGIAIAIAHANFPQAGQAIHAVLLAVIVGAIVSVPYLAWTKEHRTAAPA